MSKYRPFGRADAGTRTPDPLLTMERRGLTPAAAQSRLASGIDRITLCQTTTPDAARYRPIPTVSAPGGRLGVILLSEQCAIEGATLPYANAAAAASRLTIRGTCIRLPLGG